MPGLLLVGFASGVVWADRFFDRVGTADSAPGNVGALFACVLLPLAIVAGTIARARLLREARRPRQSKGPSPAETQRHGPTRSARSGLPTAARLLGSGLCLLVSFHAGHAGLSARLVSAARDAELAVAPPRDASESGRLVEARVTSRRSSGWGIEVVLSGIRALDARGPVPRRLLLRLRDAGPGATGDLPGSVEKRASRLLRPQSRLRMAIRILPLHSLRNPGTPDRERAWARRGLAARAHLVDPAWLMVVEERGGWGPRHWSKGLARIRSDWTTTFAAALAELEMDTGLVRALSLGDRSGLSQDLRAALRVLGLSHLIAVSGLHVGLVGGLIGGLASALATRRIGVGPRRVGLGRRSFGLALGAAAASGALYAWSTGASTSALRAALLLCLFALARLSHRGLSPGRALAWTALGLLAWDPASLFDLGAQLSFGACAALIAGGIWRGEDRWSASPGAVPAAISSGHSDSGIRARWGSALGETFRGSLAVSLATGPIVAAAGLPLCAVSPVLNVLAIPWTAAVLLPCSLLATLASPWAPRTWVQGLVLPAHGTEQVLLAIGAVLPVWPAQGGLPLGVASALGLVGVWAIRRRSGLPALFAWLLLAVVGVPPSPSGSGLPQRPRIVFFDMGQGDAALVEGEGARLLVDTGGGPPDGTGGAALLRALRALGVSDLDVVVVTHGDLDHRGGARRLLEQLRVGELWLPAGAEADERLAGLARTAEDRGVRVRWLGARAAPVEIADLEIDLLSPMSVARRPRDPPGPGRADRSWNDASLVLRVRVADYRILFAADVGLAVESRLSREPARVSSELLKLGHHGSRHSTSPEFLRAVSPRRALLSAPCIPSRGLPNAAVLDRLQAEGIAVSWTGRDGAVTVAPARGDPRDLAAGWGHRRTRCRGSGAPARDRTSLGR